MPFSGEVLRHFLSGKLEHYSKYQDGFRVGMAYWWDENGLVTKAMKGWGGNSEEFDPSGFPKSLRYLFRNVGSVDPRKAKPLFSAERKAIERVGMGNDRNYRISSTNINRLHLNGQVRIFSDQGTLKLLKPTEWLP